MVRVILARKLHLYSLVFINQLVVTFYCILVFELKLMGIYEVSGVKRGFCLFAYKLLSIIQFLNHTILISKQSALTFIASDFGFLSKGKNY